MVVSNTVSVLYDLCCTLLHAIILLTLVSSSLNLPFFGCLYQGEVTIHRSFLHKHCAAVSLCCSVLCTLAVPSIRLCCRAPCCPCVLWEHVIHSVVDVLSLLFWVGVCMHVCVYVCVFMWMAARVLAHIVHPYLCLSVCLISHDLTIIHGHLFTVDLHKMHAIVWTLDMPCKHWSH